MFLRYLPVNQCWAFLFGDRIIDVDGQFLFPTRDEAVSVAKGVRLFVTKSGLVL